LIKDYIIDNISINNVPKEVLEQGFDDFVQDLDDPVVFSYFLNKHEITEGITIVNNGDVGYEVPCVTVYIDYSNWCSWSEEMKAFWKKTFHPELHNVEKSKGYTHISLKLSDEEVNNIIIPVEELLLRFHNV
tara:strand:+ start:90 stop:485 length:396 start_codon:yes stop_codon:yes gene_type:complete